MASAAFPANQAGILEQARRDPEILERVLAASVALALAERTLRAESGDDITAEMKAVVIEFHRRHGLTDPDALLRWYQTNQCSTEDLHLLLFRQSALRWAARNIGSKLDLYMLDYLRWTGEFTKLQQRSAPDA